MLINTKKGDVLTFEAYTSTAVTLDALLESGNKLKSDWDEGAIFKITVPKGKRGMYINSVSAFEDKEYEYLLKRNTKFKVKDIKTNKKEFKSKGKLKLVELEVID